MFWFIASIVCLESKVQRKGKSNKNASYQTAIDFAHSAILGMEGEKRGSFHKYPNHSISSFCKSVWKKGKKKFPCLSSMCHNHSLSRKNIKRILSSQQPFQFFGLLSNFKKKVKKNFLNLKGFFQMEFLVLIYEFSFFLNSLLMYMFYCSAFLASIGPF